MILDVQKKTFHVDVFFRRDRVAARAETKTSVLALLIETFGRLQDVGVDNRCGIVKQGSDVSLISRQQALLILTKFRISKRRQNLNSRPSLFDDFDCMLVEG